MTDDLDLHTPDAVILDGLKAHPAALYLDDDSRPRAKVKSLSLTRYCYDCLTHHSNPQ